MDRLSVRPAPLRCILLSAILTTMACGEAYVGGPDAGSDEDAGTVDATLQVDSVPADSQVPDAAPTVDIGPPPPQICQVSLCMAGAFSRADGANPQLAQTCAQLPGLVKSCDSNGCDPLFLFIDFYGARDALIDALDTTGDGIVDQADELCEINVVGYSWGGVNVAEMARQFALDPRVAASRQTIDRMMLIDPFSPVVSIDIPPNVKHVWEYRHSSSPANDCSAMFPLGPYQGLPINCFGSTVCSDQDYSLTPAKLFGGPFGNYYGSEIGHCTIMSPASAAVLHNIATNRDYPHPPPHGH